MQILHDKIIIHAREWLGTPFLHQGRKKDIGCDCIGLVIGVLQEIGLHIDGKLPQELDQRDYTMQPDGRRLKETLGRYFVRMNQGDMHAGCVALMRFEKDPQHVGFIARHPSEKEEFSLIHCYQNIGKVVEHRLDAKWQRRLVDLYCIREV